MTPATPPQPPRSEGQGNRPVGTEDTPVTFTPPDAAPSEASELVAIDAPVATGAGITAPMPGAGGLSTITVGGRLRDLWRLLTQNPKVMVGLSIVVFFILVAIFGPMLLHTDP